MATNTGIPIEQYMANQAANPTLPTGGEVIPVLSNTNEQYLQNSGQMVGDNSLIQDGQVPAITSGNPLQATTTDPNDALQYINPLTGQYTAATVGNQMPQGTAEQMQVSNEATVAGQLANLYAQTANGQTPDWARGSVNKAENMLAARGMGASSIAGRAITGAVQESALPIAMQDAATYFKADLSNFEARQQTNLANLQARQAAMLSDQAAINAASQFNASSSAQTQQFMATLTSNINEQNANRIQSMNEYNSNRDFAVQQYNSQMEFERAKFNSEAQFAIEQSNVLWRRTLNQANTAAVNAANMTNVQNKLQISQTALNNLWQQARDEAAWLYSSAENERNRQYNTAQVANTRSYANNQKPGLSSLLGSLAAGIFL